MEKPADIVVCPDANRLAKDAAERIIAVARGAIARRGRFLLVLSGGSTPERTYRELARMENRSRLDWSKIWLFFGDERHVPLNDPRSNYHLVAESLLSPTGIGSSNVFAIVPKDSAEIAAADYENRMRAFFQIYDASKFPRFDLVLLGLGDDGHTASLFPGSPSLAETTRWVTSSPPGVLPPPVDRITTTLPVINAARQILFLVSGSKKASTLRSVLEAPDAHEKYPAAAVHPGDGQITWLVDEAAASLLSSRKRFREPTASSAHP
jgi:6-phosphogluconolactonase